MVNNPEPANATNKIGRWRYVWTAIALAGSGAIVGMFVGLMVLVRGIDRRLHYVILSRPGDDVTWVGVGGVCGWITTGEGLPSGWLPLDGKTVRVDDYPVLVKDLMGRLPIHGGQLTLPDYRGLGVFQLLGSDVGVPVGYPALVLLPPSVIGSAEASVAPIVWGIRAR